MLSGEDNHQSILSEIVQEIIKTEANLFNEFDLLILNQFISLNSIQKYEVQKLINRRHTDIRIDATDVKCSLLKSAPLIVLDRLSFLSLNELLDILSQQELKVITKSLKINSIKQNVDHLRSSILNHSKTQSTLFGQTSSEVTISLIKRTIFKNKRLIYLDQDARNTFHRVFVLYNRTKVWPENDNLMLDCILSSLKSNPKHFFKYEYSRNQDIFKTRLDLIEYIDALKIEFDFSLSMDSNDEDTREKFNSCKVKYSELCEVDQDNAVFPWLECYKPIHVYARIMHNAINFLSKEALKQKKNPGAFTELVQHLNMLINQKYHSKKRGKWYEKLALVLDYHVKDKEAAIGICKRGLDCLNEPLIGVSFRSVLTKRLNKIEKIEIDTEDTPEYNTVCIQAVKHVKSGPGKALYIDEETEEKVHVEELVMRYYIRNGYKASHSENSIIQMIFAYLFFDIIFHSKKECFESPFQDRPLDFGTKYFRESRFNEIEARLTDIFNNQYHHIIETVDKQHRELETQCVGMNWKGYDFETIIEICDAIGGEKLSLICELFIDSREYSGGCPDLCLWKDGQVKFSEVKGEGDVLSAKQLTWLEFFTKNGIECEVFQVLISGKKKSRKMMLENDVDLDCIEPVVVKKMKL